MVDEVEAADSGAAAGVSEDAGDGDRGADRLGVVDRCSSERVAGVAAGVSAAGPGGRTTYVAGEIAQCDFWFPPIELPVGFGQVRTPGAAAGVDDGLAGIRGGRRRC